MLYTLARSQFIHTSLDIAWSFFSDPGNLCRITPQWLCLEMTCKKPEPMYAGQILTYTVQALPGLKTDWVTEITHVAEPRYFVDEQRLGPYAFWHHQHRFREEDGGVRMDDLVSYALPFGFLGALVHRVLIRKRLESIFAYRREALDSLFPISAPGLD